ncbi:alpha/beta hydrolase [Sunxiuqinia sp. A32]|uniref:alpha/beta hydrolase n=1 Tax=Sunxiuqinia sp. A32 TaxID=3461496 RepID=UPI0040466873
MKLTLLSFLILFLSFASSAQDINYKLLNDLPYYEQSAQQGNDYIQSRCKLDFYYPENVENFPTVVWFHGGGLKGGSKEIPDALKNKGIAVVGVNYRLYPKAKCPAYLEDAATAVAWTMKNISKYGGDSNLVFVSGHSAGGYLTSMIGLDKSWLKKYDLDANNLAGLIPFSGHTITHMTVREERGIPDTQPIVDKYAPLYHVRADASPLLLITGDREMEMLGRYEENAYMMRMMKIAGHQRTTLYELDGYGHGMTYPAFPLLIEFVRNIQREKAAR